MQENSFVKASTSEAPKPSKKPVIILGIFMSIKTTIKLMQEFIIFSLKK